MGAVLTEVVIDAGDPDALAAFCADVLGWERTSTGLLRRRVG